MKKKLNAQYWNKRYLEDNIPWDVGNITTPIQDYFENLGEEAKTLKILVPGSGTGHEAQYLFEKGFKNVYVCDWAELALQQFQKQVPHFPAKQLICNDFFTLDMQFDIIIEQTFFCAIDPKLREKYAAQVHSLLKENGKLIGLLFNRTFEYSPPYGGSQKEYEILFQKYFNILKMEECKNSITPRLGSELFIEFLKK